MTIEKLMEEYEQLLKESKELYMKFSKEVNETDLRRFNGDDEQFLTPNEKLSIAGKEVNKKYEPQQKKLNDLRRQIIQKAKEVVQRKPEKIREQFQDLDKIDRAVQDILDETEFWENAVVWILRKGRCQK